MHSWHKVRAKTCIAGHWHHGEGTGVSQKEAEAIVPQELVDGTSLVGPAGWVRERVAAYKEAGVTILNVNPIGKEPDKDLAQVREWLED